MAMRELHEQRAFLAACQGVKYDIPDFDRGSKQSRNSFKWQKEQQEADKKAGRHPFGNKRSFTEEDLNKVLAKNGKTLGINSQFEKNLKKARIKDVFAPSS